MSKKHLTSDPRYTISVMYQQGHKQKDIAATIGKNKSVVSREIKRNTNPKTGKYHHLYAKNTQGAFSAAEKDDLLSETGRNIISTRRLFSRANQRQIKV